MEAISWSGALKLPHATSYPFSREQSFSHVLLFFCLWKSLDVIVSWKWKHPFPSVNASERLDVFIFLFTVGERNSLPKDDWHTCGDRPFWTYHSVPGSSKMPAALKKKKKHIPAGTYLVVSKLKSYPGQSFKAEQRHSLTKTCHNYT